MPLKTSIAQAIRAFCLALVLLPLALIAPASAQAPEPRVALVLGNTDYRAGPLATSLNDAGLIAETLRNAGFDVTGAANLDGEQTRRAFREFLDKAAAAGPQAVIFVYLAGRGLQFEGDNYFVPIDATLARDSDVPAQAVRISDLTRPLAGTPLKARMFVLDLARANNFAQGGQPLAPGLALVEPEDGSLVAFNAAPGTFGPDEQPPYGAYAQALSEMMREGGLPVDEVFARTRLRVNELTRGAEVPWHASKINVPFVFFERAPGAPAPAVSPEARANIARRPIREFPVEEAYAVALDRDTIPAYQDFLNAYPNSPLSRRVRALLAARREALIWRRAVTANRPEAYWTYIRRYPQGPHFADARRRLVLIAAPLDPPPQFTFYDYDVPPPPPDEIEIIDRRRTYFFDDPDYGPPPPAPVLLIGPRERDYYVPPPPPPASRGFLPIPLGIVAPFARPVERPGGFAAPAFMPQPPRNPPASFTPVQTAPGQGAPPPGAQPGQQPGQFGRPGAPGQPPPAGQAAPAPQQAAPPQAPPGQGRPGQPGQPARPGPAPQPGVAAPPGSPAQPNALPSGNALPPGGQPPGTRPGGPPGQNARPGGPGAPPPAGAAPQGGRPPGDAAAPPPSTAPANQAPASAQPQPGPRAPGGPAAPGAAPSGPRPAPGPGPGAAPGSPPATAPAPHAAPPPAAAPPRPAAPPPAAAPPRPAAPPPAAAPPRPAAPPPAAAPPRPAAPPPAAAPPRPAAPPPAAAPPRPAAPPPAAAPPRPAAPPPAAAPPRPAAPPPAAAPPRPAAPPPAAAPPRPAAPPPAAAPPRPAAPPPAAAKPPCGAPGLPPCPH
jgi:uncharacterized caspase-like protein